MTQDEINQSKDFAKLLDEMATAFDKLPLAVKKRLEKGGLNITALSLGAGAWSIRELLGEQQMIIEASHFERVDARAK